jgi:hypothetical protein
MLYKNIKIILYSKLNLYLNIINKIKNKYINGKKKSIIYRKSDGKNIIKEIKNNTMYDLKT